MMFCDLHRLLFLPDLLMVRNEKKIKKCNAKASAFKSGFATGTAIGAVIGGVALSTVIGPAAFGAAGVGANALKSTVDLIPNGSVCGGKPKDPVLVAVTQAFAEISSKLDEMTDKLSSIHSEIKTGQLRQFYAQYTNKIINLRNLYKNALDQNGLIDIEGNPHNAETFVKAALDEAPRLDVCMDQLWGMVKGQNLFNSMFLHSPSFFCNIDVRQYYNTLFLEGYDLLFKVSENRGNRNRGKRKSR